MKLLRHAHHAQRLAIAFRFAAAVMSSLRLVDVAALLANYDHRLPFELRQSGDNGRIVAEVPVAVQLDEIGKQPLDIVLGGRSIGAPCEVDHFPGWAAGSWLSAAVCGG